MFFIGNNFQLLPVRFSFGGFSGTGNSLRLSFPYKTPMKINPRKICSHISYKIKELADILAIDEKTCFRWIEQGLRTIPGRNKPFLIRGREVKDFIRNRKLKKKITLNRSQFLCLTCKVARYAKKGSIRIVDSKKIALCRVCNGKMSKIF